MTGIESKRLRRSASASTLIELLVVIGVIAIMSAALFGALNGGDSAKLQSAQLMMTNLVTNARGVALSSGRRTRVLVHADLSSSQPAGRFLRFVAVQQMDPGSATWTTIKTVELPKGVYVVPLSPRAIPGLVGVANGSAANDWTLPSAPNAELGSTLFVGAGVSVDLRDGARAANFQGVQITERGTLAKLDGTGWSTSAIPTMLIVAAGRAKSPGTYISSESPVELPDANTIRGAFLSSYAVPFLINDKGSL